MPDDINIERGSLLTLAHILILSDTATAVHRDGATRNRGGMAEVWIPERRMRKIYGWWQ